jgi:hypothetical protein
VLEPERRWVHLLKQPYLRNASITQITGSDGRWQVRAYAEKGPPGSDLGVAGT